MVVVGVWTVKHELHANKLSWFQGTYGTIGNPGGSEFTIRILTLRDRLFANISLSLFAEFNFLRQNRTLKHGSLVM